MNNLKIMQTGILKYLMVLAVSCCLTSSFVVSQEDETIGIESVTTKSQEDSDRSYDLSYLYIGWKADCNIC